MMLPAVLPKGVTLSFSVLKVVAALIQLQDLAAGSDRMLPLHVVAQVRHPRTLELIKYITADRHSAISSSQKGAVAAVTADQQQHAVPGNHQAAGGHGGGESQKQGHVGGEGAQRGGGQGAVLDVDVLLPDELLSGLLTQVSVQPELLSVMNDLFDAEGE